jgi:hypothetical protein
MKQINVVHVINNLGGGGAEKLIKDIFIHWKTQNVRLDLIILTGKNNIYDRELRNHHINIITLSNGSIYNPLLLKKLINKFKPYDLIHVHLFPAFYYVSLIKKYFGLKSKLIFHEHSTMNKRRHRPLFKYVEQYIYKEYDHIICISNDAKINLLNWICYNDQSVSILFNGIFLNEFIHAKSLDLPKPMGVDTKIISILMTGRFSEQKDQGTLIKALQYLPSNIHVYFAGEGKLLGKNKKLARQTGVEDRVTFLGFISSIASYMKSADINVLSSNWEGFGLAAVEGMATGKPFIGSDIEGVNKIIGHGGLLFEKGNPKDLAHKIKLLINDPNLYHYYTEQGLKRAKQFSIENTIEQLNKIYQKVIFE